MASAVTMREDFLAAKPGIALDVQQAIEDLPFDCHFLFSDKTDDTLHSFKDSMTALKFLGVYVPSVQRCHYGVQQQQQYRPQHFFSSETAGLP